MHILAHQATATDVLQSISMEMTQRLRLSGGFFLLRLKGHRYFLKGGKDLEDLCESICDGLKQIRHANFTIEESLLDADFAVDWVHGLNRLIRTCHERDIPRESIEELEIFLANALELEEKLMDDSTETFNLKQMPRINENGGESRSRKTQQKALRQLEERLIVERENFRLERAKDQALVEELQSKLEEEKTKYRVKLMEVQTRWNKERTELQIKREEEKNGWNRSLLLEKRGERESLFRHKALLEDVSISTFPELFCKI